MTLAKKICIIHKVKSLDPRSFYKQSRSLKKAGYKITIIGFHEKSEEIDGIKIVAIDCPPKRFTRLFIKNYNIFITALKEKADIYHFHDLDFIPWALIIKFFNHSKVIYDIHEAHPEYMLLKDYLPKIFRHFFSFLILLTEKIAIKFFDAIIPNDNFIAAGFQHKNSVVIFNYPLLDFFNKNSSLPFQEREYDLFYHGSLPKYHFEIMLNIAENLNSNLIKNKWGIIMSPLSPQEWAKNQVKKRNLENNFVFLPYTKYLEVSSYLNKAKIGIIPLPAFKKFMKNIPLKMFEFMGCGLPIVLSDLPPSQQFIQGEDCAIAVEPDNVNLYATAITLLLNDPEKSIEMGKKGKKLVFERYNWQKEEKKLIQLYDNLTKERNLYYDKKEKLFKRNNK